MNKAFILGLSSRVDESPYKTTEELYNVVGHNSGNLAFHYAIDLHLGGNLPAIPWTGDVRVMNSFEGIGVLPCANQLGPHANLAGFAEKLAKINSPLVAIGLGAQASLAGEIPQIPEGTLAWLRAIVAHAPSSAPNIAVRGMFTLDVLKKHGLADNAVVLGCPSLFINPDPQLGLTIAKNAGKTDRIAVAAGHFGWQALSRLESSLTRLVTATRGGYVTQSPMEMLKLGRGEAGMLAPQALKQCRDYIAPELAFPEFIDWSRAFARCFFNVPAWMEYLRSFDFVIGTRIHGVVLALQAGVPALCIAHDSRTLELCRTMLIPHVAAKEVWGGIARDDLARLFKFDPGGFDTNRAGLARNYMSFLNGNGLQANASHFERLLSPKSTVRQEA